MRRPLICLVACCLSSLPLRAAEPEGKIVRELWDAAYLEGAKSGFFHTTVREVEQSGRKVLHTTMEMDLQIKKFKDTVRLRMTTGDEETADGKVIGVSMIQFLDRGQQLVLSGTVQGNQLHVTVRQPPQPPQIDKRIPWNDQVIGLYRQERIFQERKAKPGDKIQYLSFEPTLNTIVTINAVVKGQDDADVLQAKKGAPGQVERISQRLLRVEAAPEKVAAPGGDLQLPGMISWLDKDLLPVRSEMELPGLGKVVLYRTTKEIATASGGQLAKLPDIGLNTLIPLNRAIPHPHDTRSAVYRITVDGVADPASAFAQDDRQTIKNVKGNSFELHVQAIRSPKARTDAPPVPAEFLESCYFLDSANPRVQRMAREAVGSETDPWRKAQSIERWVYRKIDKKNYTITFATASQVAENLEGDCRQHAVLAAALCRAAGLPSRTAVGLVYVLENGRRPVMGFHMWTEVWLDGQWVAIDATLGRGSIGAAHIKIADSSWHDVQSLTPMLPVSRVLGKVSIEVVSVDAGGEVK